MLQLVLYPFLSVFRILSDFLTAAEISDNINLDVLNVLSSTGTCTKQGKQSCWDLFVTAFQKEL